MMTTMVPGAVLSAGCVLMHCNMPMIGSVTTYSLLMGQLRHREVKQLAIGHITSNWGGRI